MAPVRSSSRAATAPSVTRASAIRIGARSVPSKSVSPRQVTNLVVLDAYGKSMEQLFPDGQFNDRWLVTSYPAFGAVLRVGYEQGAGGLVPLLAAMYAGC